ncbi:hypothetical protein ACJROX_15140 [Pseudalkalibacillus sp. A8]|uniref:hypothetical protein n=1 Tax=Pseudalkalibacillus sp. A8 TaxID=3382641 RepID=UPI0038B5264B
MAEGKRLLFLAVYGMEVVECGGALAKNILNGGKSFASIMLSSEKSRPQIQQAAEMLGVSIEFTNFQYGEVDLSVDSKKKIAQII